MKHSLRSLFFLLVVSSFAFSSLQCRKNAPTGGLPGGTPTDNGPPPDGGNGGAGGGGNSGGTDPNQGRHIDPVVCECLITDTDSDGDCASNDLETQYGTDPKNPDTDNDGIRDGCEGGGVGTGHTDPKKADTDGDGLPDGIEDKNHDGLYDVLTETDPVNPDTDGDTILDGIEDSGGCISIVENNVWRCSGVPASSCQCDLWHNGVSDAHETNPRLQDTDGDGFPDGPMNGRVGEDKNRNGVCDTLPLKEQYCVPGLGSCTQDAQYETCGYAADTDGDGLSDSEEDFNRNGRFDPGVAETDPLRADRDADCLNDKEEKNYVNFKTNKRVPTSPNMPDSDNDGLPDGLEVKRLRFNPQTLTCEPVSCVGPSVPWSCSQLVPVNSGIDLYDGFDTDGDGIPDGFDASSGAKVAGEDANANGCIDPGESDPCVPVDLTQQLPQVGDPVGKCVSDGMCAKKDEVPKNCKTTDGSVPSACRNAQVLVCADNSSRPVMIVRPEEKDVSDTVDYALALHAKRGQNREVIGLFTEPAPIYLYQKGTPKKFIGHVFKSNDPVSFDETNPQKPESVRTVVGGIIKVQDALAVKYPGFDALRNLADDVHQKIKTKIASYGLNWTVESGSVSDAHDADAQTGQVVKYLVDSVVVRLPGGGGVSHVLSLQNLQKEILAVLVGDVDVSWPAPPTWPATRAEPVLYEVKFEFFRRKVGKRNSDGSVKDVIQTGALFALTPLEKDWGDMSKTPAQRAAIKREMDVFRLPVHEITSGSALARYPGDTARNCVAFNPGDRPQADILLVVDNSQSMEPYIAATMRSARDLAYALNNEQNLDWRVGVTTSDMGGTHDAYTYDPYILGTDWKDYFKNKNTQFDNYLGVDGAAGFNYPAKTETAGDGVYFGYQASAYLAKDTLGKDLFSDASSNGVFDKLDTTQCQYGDDFDPFNFSVSPYCCQVEGAVTEEERLLKCCTAMLARNVPPGYQVIEDKPGDPLHPLRETRDYVGVGSSGKTGANYTIENLPVGNDTLLCYDVLRHAKMSESDAYGSTFEQFPRLDGKGLNISSITVRDDSGTGPRPEPPDSNITCADKTMLTDLAPLHFGPTFSNQFQVTGTVGFPPVSFSYYPQKFKYKEETGSGASKSYSCKTYENSDHRNVWGQKGFLIPPGFVGAHPANPRLSGVNLMIKNLDYILVNRFNVAHQREMIGRTDQWMTTTNYEYPLQAAKRAIERAAIKGRAPNNPYKIRDRSVVGVVVVSDEEDSHLKYLANPSIDRAVDMENDHFKEYGILRSHFSALPDKVCKNNGAEGCTANYCESLYSGLLKSSSKDYHRAPKSRLYSEQTKTIRADLTGAYCVAPEFYQSSVDAMCPAGAAGQFCRAELPARYNGLYFLKEGVDENLDDKAAAQMSMMFEYQDPLNPVLTKADGTPYDNACNGEDCLPCVRYLREKQYIDFMNGACSPSAATVPQSQDIRTFPRPSSSSQITNTASLYAITDKRECAPLSSSNEPGYGQGLMDVAAATGGRYTSLCRARDTGYADFFEQIVLDLQGKASSLVLPGYPIEHTLRVGVLGRDGKLRLQKRVLEAKGGFSYNARERKLFFTSLDKSDFATRVDGDKDAQVFVSYRTWKPRCAKDCLSGEQCKLSACNDPGRLDCYACVSDSCANVSCGACEVCDPATKKCRSQDPCEGCPEGNVCQQKTDGTFSCNACPSDCDLSNPDPNRCTTPVVIKCPPNLPGCRSKTVCVSRVGKQTQCRQPSTPDPLNCCNNPDNRICAAGQICAPVKACPPGAESCLPEYRCVKPEDAKGCPAECPQGTVCAIKPCRGESCQPDYECRPLNMPPDICSVSLPAQCTTHNDCPNSTHCLNGQCVNSCQNTDQCIPNCPAGKTCNVARGCLCE